MKMIQRIVVVVFVVSCAPLAHAAEIKVLCSNGMKAVIEELVPRFERATTHKVTLQFEPSALLKKRIDAGEPFDLAVLTTTLIDEEIKAGRLASDSRTILARSGLGLSIRAGSKRPDIASVDAFK